jgi:hypothetical protein
MPLLYWAKATPTEATPTSVVLLTTLGNWRVEGWLVSSWAPYCNYGCAIDSGGLANHGAFNWKTTLGVDGFLGPRKIDDLVGICRLGPWTEIVGTVACHATNIYGFRLAGGLVGGRDHHVGNCCALGVITH